MGDSEDREYYDDEVDLGEIISALSRRKWLILGIVGISLVLAIGWGILGSRDLTEALIQLNFSGMEKHKYPDGSQFDMYDIMRLISPTGQRQPSRMPNTERSLPVIQGALYS